jgi:hypothetical protein
MKRCVLSLVIVVLAASPVLTQTKAAAGFEKLKSLAGQWQAKATDGQTVNISYEIVSGGSALMETLMPANEPSMVTIYHLDGNKLLMTHYCSAGNQPRMHAAVNGGAIKTLDFTFLNATNMAKRSDGHMHHLTLNIQDRDHMMQVWTWRENGKDVQTTYYLQRKKQP